MKKILFALALLAFSFTGVYAQTDSTVVEPTRDSVTLTVNDDSGFLVNVLTGILDASKKTSRQEKKRSYRYTGWHVEPYIGLGFVAGPLENSTAKINYGESYSVDFGLKSRYQFTGIYSLTFNVGFMHNRYKITDGMINGITAPASVMTATPIHITPPRSSKARRAPRSTSPSTTPRIKSAPRWGKTYTTAK